MEVRDFAAARVARYYLIFLLFSYFASPFLYPGT
jgi:hypothetical protein